jgi:hypothetical protein
MRVCQSCEQLLLFFYTSPGVTNIFATTTPAERSSYPLPFRRNMFRLTHRSPAVSAVYLQIRRCTPLRLAQYTTTQHPVTRPKCRPWNENSDGGNGSRGSSWTGAAFRSFALYLGAELLYVLWLENQRERNLYAAFMPRTMTDNPHFVQRPTVREKVRQIFTTGTGTYEVIVGNCGTGKSALLKKVAEETVGALYVFIPDHEDVNGALWRALREALGGERPNTLTSAILGRLTNADKGKRGEDVDRVLRVFERAAARFKDEHNRGAVLVLDNVDVIARMDPGLLERLQGMAKFAADNDLYKVVFVCTDEVAVRRMTGKLRSLQVFD